MGKPRLDTSPFSSAFQTITSASFLRASTAQTIDTFRITSSYELSKKRPLMLLAGTLCGPSNMNQLGGALDRSHDVLVPSVPYGYLGLLNTGTLEEMTVHFLREYEDIVSAVRSQYGNAIPAIHVFGHSTGALVVLNAFLKAHTSGVSLPSPIGKIVSGATPFRGLPIARLGFLNKRLHILRDLIPGNGPLIALGNFAVQRNLIAHCLVAGNDHLIPEESQTPEDLDPNTHTKLPEFEHMDCIAGPPEKIEIAAYAIQGALAA